MNAIYTNVKPKESSILYGDNKFFLSIVMKWPLIPYYYTASKFQRK